MSTDTELVQRKLMNYKTSHSVVVELADQVIDGRAELLDAADRLRGFYRTLLGVDEFADLSHIDLAAVDFEAIIGDEIDSRADRDQIEALDAEAAEAGNTEQAE
jgi:hypothetical protein